MNKILALAFKPVDYLLDWPVSIFVYERGKHDILMTEDKDGVAGKYPVDFGFLAPHPWHPILCA